MAAPSVSRVRSSGPSSRAIEIEGLDDLRRELRRIDKAWLKELTALSKGAATVGRDAARQKANALGGMQAKAAGAIKAYGGAGRAAVGFRTQTKGYPMAGPAFWGAKRHTGWYGGWWKGRYDPQKAGGFAGGRAQFPAWIGTSWAAGVKGQGPYAINAALADKRDEIGDVYLEGLVAIARRAFPD